MRRPRSLFTRHDWIFQLLFVVVAASAACCLSVKAIDRPVAEFMNANVQLEWLLTARLLSVVSTIIPFALLIILIFHYVINGESRKIWYRIIALMVSVCGAILCVEIIKVTFYRATVSEYLDIGAYGFHYPGFADNPDLSSFPSEYGGISGTIAATLCKMMPSYRPTLILLVLILTGGQIVTGVDFVSDILSGVAIGISSFLVAERLFTFIESRSQSRIEPRFGSNER
jgi:hypothetical protein